MNLQKNSSRRRQRTTAIPPTCVWGCIRLDTKASRYWRPPCSTPFLSWRRFRALRLPRQLRGNRQPSVLYLLKDLQLVRRARHTVPSLRSSHEQHQAELTYIGVSCTITYENGANVNTAFVTNMMGDLICTTAPDLYKTVKKANDDNLKQSKKALRNTTQYRKFERIYCIHNGKIVLTKKPDWKAWLEWERVSEGYPIPHAANIQQTFQSRKNMSKKRRDYDEFIEKFKPKKTTDDCYTPRLCRRQYSDKPLSLQPMSLSPY